MSIVMVMKSLAFGHLVASTAHVRLNVDSSTKTVLTHRSKRWLS